MPQIEMSEEVFNAARERALSEGFSSVDEFVADLVAEELDAPPENFDHVFTPERLAKLDQISDDMLNGGKTFTDDEVAAHFTERSRQAIADQAR